MLDNRSLSATRSLRSSALIEATRVGDLWDPKRVLDVMAAAVGLFMLAPLLALVALALIIDSPGPILFRQNRTGLGGKPFRIYKFRTMRVQDNGPVVQQATRNDKRVTRVGRVLRRTSIDELPQLLNVLRGEM